ncbi:exportin-T-like isoform X2 [Homarus americanus]|uniref:exportin-T-like isoform X2 n=1 Tax=Homarus americanus TaxID=6706 RepID=UPI001C47BCA5|nr:exportin-T-like isoform X2 [Homarus americanus]
MDAQMLQGLWAPDNQQQHTRALDYLQQLRESSDGWQLCGATLTSGGSSLDEKVKFVCLQVLEHYARTRYMNSIPEEQTLFRQHLSQWMTTLCMTSEPEKVFIQNKTAQLLSLMFVVDYPSRWPTFIADLLSMLQLGSHAVDLYLRILLAIDGEVVDREIIHSQAETDRNSRIKDTMREHCVVDLTNSWYDILVKYDKSHPELVCQCHDVIGAYIAWIDISLIANDRFVCKLVDHLKEALIREAAADCIHEIITKGMDPVTKTQLIESFVTVLDQAGVLKPVDDDDSDFLVKLARLINGIGVQLILAWQKLEKKDNTKREMVRLAVENKVTLLLTFMASDYDDISAAVFDFARDYIQLIKQIGHITNVERGLLENMLYVVITKTKYDESYNFEQAGEDEAMFDDYRKKLKVVFDNLAALIPELVLKVSKEYVVTTLNRWQASSYEDVEAAVSLLYNLGEALPASHGNHFSGPSQVKTSTMQEMMRLLVTSGVSGHNHPAVSLQFFECVARYEKFFSCEPQYIPGILAAFLDHRGMRNRLPRVRSRTSYLFSRMVRCLKNHIVGYTEDILSQLTELLVMAPPNNGQITPLLTNDDQLYVFEAAAMLIISGNTEAQRKEILMRNLLSPVFAKVTCLAERLAQEQDPVRQMSIAKSICHATSVTARTSKAFSNQNTIQACGCVQMYLDALQLFITCLNVGMEREMVGSGVRQLMHRLVVCLDGGSLLPLLPVASQALLHTPSPTVLTEYLPLINQIITKFQKDISPFLQSIFVPLVSAIFTALSEPLEENDEEERRTRRLLQRNYYLFLTTIVSNNLLDVMASLDSNILQQVLMSVVQGAVEFPDPVAQKNCFVILRRLTEAWGVKDVGPPGFVEFLYTQVVPACFLAPLKTTFDLNDAQTILALHESVMCLQSVYKKRGEELLSYLRSEYLPKIELSPQLINEYCQALTSEAKFFRNYSKLFFQRAKS